MADKIKTVHLEGTTLRIADDTKIVRYMKLEVLLLMLHGWVYIPSHATLGRSDRLETGILFDLPVRWSFWENWAQKIGPRLEGFVRARVQGGPGRSGIVAPSLSGRGMLKTHQIS